jgi:hypothetical protein
MEEPNAGQPPSTALVPMADKTMIAKDGRPRNISGLRPNPLGRRGKARKGSTLKKALILGLASKKARKLADALIGLANDKNIRALELLMRGDERILIALCIYSLKSQDGTCPCSGGAINSDAAQLRVQVCAVWRPQPAERVQMDPSEQIYGDQRSGCRETGLTLATREC